MSNAHKAAATMLAKERDIRLDITKPPAAYPDPTPEQLASPEFQAVWKVIKGWDIGVPDWYEGYTGAMGNHVVAILNALKKAS